MNFVLKKLLLVLLAVINIIGAGCVYTQGTFSDEKNITRYKPYELPIKFYIEDISFTKARNGLTFFSEAEAERWKNQLGKYYPQVFSNSPEQALKVKFIFKASSYAKNVPAYAPLTMLLSLPTLGLIPGINKFDMDSSLQTIIEDVEKTTQFSLKFYARGNIGIIGLLLPTRFLLPSAKNSLFTSKSWSAIHDYTVEEEKMKSFLKIFVAQIYSFPKEKIWILYNSKFGKNVQLLE